jgi:hypothetical protein
VDSLRIGREGGLGLAGATGGSAGLLHQSPRACRRLLSLSSFHLQIHGKRKWTRGDLNPCPPPCEGDLRHSRVFADVLKTAYIRRIVEACVLSCSPVIAPVTVKSLSEVPTSRTGSLSFTRSDAAVRLDRKWNVNLVQA